MALPSPQTHISLQSGLIESINQISQVYISHAHLDHVGYLHEFASKFLMPRIYMTNLTMLLTQFQIKRMMSRLRGNRKLIDIESLKANRISCVSYHQMIPFHDYRASFHEAGHIPGAMMTLFQYRGKKILYTGDYSLHPTPWTNGCQLPEEKIDILILCGLHARHPDAIGNVSGLEYLIQTIYHILQNHRSVYCNVNQLSKGIELIRQLQTSVCSEYPIYIYTVRSTILSIRWKLLVSRY